MGLYRYVSKLYHEVSIMRELNHPHIVKLMEVFYAKRQIYLIMELASGGELFDLLTRQPNDHFTESFSAVLMTQMMSAVLYLHSRGIVHRDLKLENFLMESKSDTLKVIFF
jgi:serine/threonine protein kinase